MALPRETIPPRDTVGADHRPLGIRRENRAPGVSEREHVQHELQTGKRSGLKVLAHVHLYLPHHPAGAECMLHAILRYGVVQRGWVPSVITDQPPEWSGEWQGIGVRHDRDPNRLNQAYMFSEVIMTHLDVTRKAIDLSRRHGRPLVHVVHNDRQLRFHSVRPNEAALVVANSDWIQDAIKWTGPTTVVYPPTPLMDYRLPDNKGDSVVLINLTQQKGALVFYDLARRNPDIKFLGVRGAYGIQEPPPTLPNLTIEDHTPDVKSIYSRARIVLMPSWYESWGRVAVEAACSGIPSITSPTPGLAESNCGYLKFRPDRPDEWNEALRVLWNDEREWGRASQYAALRAAQLDKINQVQLKELCAKMEELS